MGVGVGAGVGVGSGVGTGVGVGVGLTAVLRAGAGLAAGAAGLAVCAAGLALCAAGLPAEIPVVTCGLGVGMGADAGCCAAVNPASAKPTANAPAYKRRIIFVVVLFYSISVFFNSGFSSISGKFLTPPVLGVNALILPLLCLERVSKEVLLLLSAFARLLSPKWRPAGFGAMPGP